MVDSSILCAMTQSHSVLTHLENPVGVAVRINGRQNDYLIWLMRRNNWRTKADALRVCIDEAMKANPDWQPGQAA